MNRCIRCQGKLIEEKMFDLPRHFLEFYCLNCGARFWINMMDLMDGRFRLN